MKESVQGVFLLLLFSEHLPSADCKHLSVEHWLS